MTDKAERKNEGFRNGEEYWRSYTGLKMGTSGKKGPSRGKKKNHKS